MSKRIIFILHIMDTFQFLLSKNDPVNFLEFSNHQEIEIFIKFYMITL